MARLTISWCFSYLEQLAKRPLALLPTPPSGHVTFADKQGNTVVAAAASKRKLEKQKKAEE